MNIDVYSGKFTAVIMTVGRRRHQYK